MHGQGGFNLCYIFTWKLFVLHLPVDILPRACCQIRIKIYNAVCMANMMTERDSAAEWESKLMATLESYNKHPGFVNHLVSQLVLDTCFCRLHLPAFTLRLLGKMIAALQQGSVPDVRQLRLLLTREGSLQLQCVRLWIFVLGA